MVEQIVELSEGFPYFAQLIGKTSVQFGNEKGTNDIDGSIFDEVLEKIRSLQSFPSLEQQYQLAVGRSAERAMLLVLLAEQSSEATLYVEERYGPALVKGEDRGIYEFADPVFRAYVKLRRLD